MSDLHNHGNSSQTTLPFTAEEWSQFRTADKGAGRSVVLLMAGIFSIGLALYAVVAYVCWFKVM
jgi:hypothetical protein